MKYTYILVIFFLLILCGLSEYNKYLACKRYYPDLNFNEYILIKDNLKIVNEIKK
jgi:hypothetical protein